MAKRGLANAWRSESLSSVNSFPSLNEVWATAETSHSARSPAKSAALSAAMVRKSGVNRDLEYEEAMRRLDNGDDNSSAGNKSDTDSQARVKVKMEASSQSMHKSWPPQKLEKPQHERARTTANTERDLSPAPPAVSASRERTPRAEGYTAPPGSQVIVLVSSSPEPEFAESHAEDSIDESYDEAKGRHSSRGWKRRDRRSGIGMPSAITTRRSVSRQPSASIERTLPPGAPFRLGRIGSSRRKTSARG